MSRTIAAAIFALLAVTAPSRAHTIATETLPLHFDSRFTDARSSTGGSGSHYVHSYCRKNGTCVRGHMAGNPGSGNHWHLNKNGSDTVTHPNGTSENVPNVAPSK
jgi:hypothetical protein